MSQSLVLDCAVMGRWNWRASSITDPEQGHCVRVSYAVLDDYGRIFERCDMLLNPPLTWGGVLPENRVHGGITMEAMREEGKPPESFQAHRLWSLLEKIDLIVCHAQNFHIAALLRFMFEVRGLDPEEAAKSIRRVYDTCAKATPVVRIPSASGRAWKSASLTESHAHFYPNVPKLSDERMKGNWQDFADAQVNAVAAVYRAVEKIAPPPAASLRVG